MRPNLKIIDADEADMLWELGVPIWFKTTGFGWKMETNLPYVKPFWQKWVKALPGHKPQLSVEIE